MISVRARRVRHPVTTLLATALLAVAMLTGCSTTDSTGDAAGSPASDTEQNPAELAEPAEQDGQNEQGESAGPPVLAADRLSFEAPTLDGANFSGESLLGEPAVLWFWAPWCPVCRQEAPEIAELSEKFGDQVRFVGVPGLAPEAEMRAFTEHYGLDSFTHVVDADGALWTRFEVPGQPAFGFVAPDGTIEMTLAAVPKDILDAKLTEMSGQG